MSNNGVSKNLAGKYLHYKGNYYIAYCLAKDSAEQEFVLYQQCYGDKGFWIRPYKMFFEKVRLENGDIVERFKPVNSKKQVSKDKIPDLLEMVKAGTLKIKHSETCDEYCITNIKESRDYVIIGCKNNDGAGYLTEFQLLDRMGYTGCIINEKINFIEKKSLFPVRFN